MAVYDIKLSGPQNEKIAKLMGEGESQFLLFFRCSVAFSPSISNYASCLLSYRRVVVVSIALLVFSCVVCLLSSCYFPNSLPF